jgi:23S rRNA (cytidine1920-2'-O)/16S rRNA (cytidine1409-2'-O)-methyltransferase
VIGKIAKERIDLLLVQRGLAESRQKAKALLIGGRVLVQGGKVQKAGSLIPVDSAIEVQDALRYVSRGGLKLEHALTSFAIDVTDSTALDVGASTGGFTDCLLQRGAKKVYAIDVGYGQLDWKLRNDARVSLFEKTNIRYADDNLIREPIDIAVVDVSFMSVLMALPTVKRFLKQGGKAVALIKPQFEVGKGRVGKGGIVRQESQRLEAVEKIKDAVPLLGFCVVDSIKSPIKGAKGNEEFFLHLVSV